MAINAPAPLATVDPVEVVLEDEVLFTVGLPADFERDAASGREPSGVFVLGFVADEEAVFFAFEPSLPAHW